MRRWTPWEVEEPGPVKAEELPIGQQVPQKQEGAGTDFLGDRFKITSRLGKLIHLPGC